MSKPAAIEWAEAAEELEGRYRAERDVERRKRLGALWRARAEALGTVAEALARAGQAERALLALRAAFAMARSAGRDSVFDVLGSGAVMLAAIDQGLTLWRVYGAMEDVESWWN